MQYSLVDAGRYQSDVHSLVLDGIDENTTYTGFLNDSAKKDDLGNRKIHFWRTGDKAYGRLYVQKKHQGGKDTYELEKNLLWDLTQNEECFKVLPEGCSYSGTATDFYSSLCKGYETIPKELHTSLIKLSIETKINPETIAGDFAKCIKRHLNTFSVKMECALENMAMDHSWAVQELNRLAERLRKEGKVNVTVDPDTLSLRYDEEEEHVEEVTVTEEDVNLVNAPAQPGN